MNSASRNGDGSDDIISGRASPINEEVDPEVSGTSHFRKLNGVVPSSGDDGGRGSTSPQAGSGGIVGNGPTGTRSASPRGFVDISGASAAGGAVDSAFDIHGGAGGGRYAGGSSSKQGDDYSGGRGGNGSAGGVVTDDFVGAMGALSLGSGDGTAPLQYGVGSGRGAGGEFYGGGSVQPGRAGGVMHGVMPPSPYNGPQMSPYNGSQIPQSTPMGGIPPLTPEIHPSGMSYQLVRVCGGLRTLVCFMVSVILLGW